MNQQNILTIKSGQLLLLRHAVIGVFFSNSFDLHTSTRSLKYFINAMFIIRYRELTDVFSLMATSSFDETLFVACAGDAFGVLLQSMGSEGLILDNGLRSVIALFCSVLIGIVFLALTWRPFRMVMAFIVSGSASGAGKIGMGIGTGVIGFGIDSLHTTFVSDTKEFITGPGTGLTKVSVTLT